MKPKIMWGYPTLLSVYLTPIPHWVVVHFCPQTVKERHQPSLQRGPRKGGRGWKKVQISVPYQSSQPSQELFSNASQEQVFNMGTPRTTDGAVECLDALLDPINAQQIWDEINFRRAERGKDLLMRGNITQENMVFNSEILKDEENLPESKEEKLPAKEPRIRGSLPRSALL